MCATSEVQNSSRNRIKVIKPVYIRMKTHPLLNAYISSNLIQHLKLLNKYRFDKLSLLL